MLCSQHSPPLLHCCTSSASTECHKVGKHFKKVTACAYKLYYLQSHKAQPLVRLFFITFILHGNALCEGSASPSVPFGHSLYSAVHQFSWFAYSCACVPPRTLKCFVTSWRQKAVRWEQDTASFRDSLLFAWLSALLLHRSSQRAAA